MAIIPPFFLDCVVAIGMRQVDSQISWTASGFLFGSKLPEPVGGWGEGGERFQIWLVSNRHVAKNLQNQGVVRFFSQKENEVIEIDLHEWNIRPEGNWIYHPNEEVDVAVLPVRTDHLSAASGKLNFFHEDKHSATVQQLKNLGVVEGQSGFLLGYPAAVHPGPTNAVIVRQSCIARIRNTYSGSSQTIIVDGTVFPGNSGGAAIITPEMAAIEGTQPIQNAYLIGIVAAYVPYIDVAASQQTGKARITFEENTGLTIIYPVDFLLETIAIAKLRQ